MKKNRQPFNWDGIEPIGYNEIYEHKKLLTKLPLGEYMKQLDPSTEIGNADKYLLRKIRMLSNERGCSASNEQIGIYIGVHPRSVQRSISNLNSLGYLIIENPTSKAREIWCSNKIG